MQWPKLQIWCKECNKWNLLRMLINYIFRRIFSCRPPEPLKGWERPILRIFCRKIFSIKSACWLKICSQKWIKFTGKFKIPRKIIFLMRYFFSSLRLKMKSFRRLEQNQVVNWQALQDKNPLPVGISYPRVFIKTLEYLINHGFDIRDDWAKFIHEFKYLAAYQGKRR